jgi:uncharacterized protein (DUF1778 family)
VKEIPEKPKTTTKLVIRVSDADKTAIEKAAKLYAKGNVSNWLRYAGTHHKPSVKDLTKS